MVNGLYFCIRFTRLVIVSRVKSSASLSNSSLSSPQQTSSLAHEVAPETPELLLLATPDQPSGGMPHILTTNHVLTLGDANSHPSWDTLLYPHPSVSCRSLLSGGNRTISSAKNRDPKITKSYTSHPFAAPANSVHNNYKENQWQMAPTAGGWIQHPPRIQRDLSPAMLSLQLYSSQLAYTNRPDMILLA